MPPYSRAFCAPDSFGGKVLVPGANGVLNKDDVHAAKAIISNAKAVLLQNEIPPDITLEAMHVARSAQTPESPGQTGRTPLVILNAAPAPSVGSNGREGQWPEELFKSMLQSCDILCVNESEAEKISGVAVAGQF